LKGLSFGPFAPAEEGFTCMVQIKGTAVLDAITLIKKRTGEDGFQKILAVLNEDAKKLFQGEVFTSSWYSLYLYTHFLEVQIREFAGGNEEVLIKGAEIATERQLRGIYKVFVKLGSPEFVLKRIAAVHATYFQGVDIKVEMMGPGNATIRYTGYEKQHRIIGYAIIGFFRKALEISGAKNVQAGFATPIEAGKGYAELAISWT
jgi:hypothetical protein